MNTVISFAVPFVAAVPAELLGASGLVAAVVAGLITGIRAPRYLSAQNRLSDSQNWRTVELVLEGAVFLTMGVQITSIVANVERDHAGVGPAVLIAAGALVLTILVRAAYVAPLLGGSRPCATATRRCRTGCSGCSEKMSTPEGSEEMFGEANAATVAAHPTARSRLVRRGSCSRSPTSTYFRRAPLGWREGTAVVWAGMRGAVTVAAAQTLPDDTPQRSVLVLIAFAVAVMSLLVQGGTIGPLLRADLARRSTRRRPTRRRTPSGRGSIELMRTSAETVPSRRRPKRADGRRSSSRRSEHELEVIAAQRAALLDARDNGTFDADVLAYALANLDASQIALEMRGGPKG